MRLRQNISMNYNKKAPPFSAGLLIL